MRIRRVERNTENRMANWVSAGCGVIANELAQAMEKRGHSNHLHRRCHENDDPDPEGLGTGLPGGIELISSG